MNRILIDIEDVINKVSNENNFPKSKIKDMFDYFEDSIKKEIRSGRFNKIMVSGFFSLSPNVLSLGNYIKKEYITYLTMRVKYGDKSEIIIKYKENLKKELSRLINIYIELKLNKIRKSRSANRIKYYEELFNNLK